MRIRLDRIVLKIGDSVVMEGRFTISSMEDTKPFLVMEEGDILVVTSIIGSKIYFAHKFTGFSGIELPEYAYRVLR